MISPHPDTTQIVAEATRKERLATLATQRRRPGLAARCWSFTNGLFAEAGILGGRLLARIRHSEGSHPKASEQAASGASRLAGDRLEAPLLMERRSRVPKIQLRCKWDDTRCHRSVTWVREHEVSQTNERLPEDKGRAPITAD